MTEPELDTILAALRHWRADLALGIDPKITEGQWQIATHFGEHPALTGGQIDQLCRELNLGWTVAKEAEVAA
jgi:flagellar biosynthesis/type III secretory pathway protein FliH